MATLPSRRLAFLFRRASRSLWVRPSLYAFGAVLALAAGPLLSRAVPDPYLALLAEDALRNLLSILASSMLAVAIFSLGTMVSAFQAAAGSATPRARPLLAEDRTAQVAIATFIGAFLFSIAGLVGLALGLFDAGGRLILFVLAVAVVAVVTTTLIGWLQALARMGGVAEAVALVEAATAQALDALARSPAAGGEPAAPSRAQGRPVHVDQFAYVQHVDAEALAAVAERLDVELFLLVRPGDWVDPGVPVVVVDAELDDELRAAIGVAFTFGRQRTFEVDPRFGLRVLAEIAARALSPAVNDPGTALDTIDATTRLLGRWAAACRRAEAASVHPRLRVVPVTAEDLVEPAFGEIARDGSGNVEVATALQRRLGTLARLDDAELAAAAARTAAYARKLAETRLDAVDRRRLAEIAEAAFAPPQALQGSTPRRKR